MDKGKQKEPKGRSRHAFMESFVKICNDEFDLPFEFVKRECNKDNKDNPDDIPNKITT